LATKDSDREECVSVTKEAKALRELYSQWVSMEVGRRTLFHCLKDSLCKRAVCLLSTGSGRLCYIRQTVLVVASCDILQQTMFIFVPEASSRKLQRCELLASVVSLSVLRLQYKIQALIKVISYDKTLSQLQNEYIKRVRRKVEMSVCQIYK
jgi:hypothetical protein